MSDSYYTISYPLTYRSIEAFKYQEEIDQVNKIAAEIRKRGALNVAVPYTLVLLAMCRDGYFSQIDEECIDIFSLLQDCPNDPHQAIYLGVLTSLPLSSEDQERLQLSGDIVRQLQELQQLKKFIPHFSDIFDYFLNESISRRSGYGGEFLLPEEIPAYVAASVNLRPGARIFNPFAGLASFGLHFDTRTKYTGQELNLTTYQLARLRAVVHGRDLDGRFQVRQEDSIWNWPYGERYDLVVAAPPLNMRLPKDSDKRNGLQDVNNFVISEGLKVLTPHGKLIVLTPLSFLSSGNRVTKLLRRRLVDSGRLEKVIAFPTELLRHTHATVALLVVSAEELVGSAPKLIDASSFLKKGRKEVRFEEAKLRDLLTFGPVDSEEYQSTIAEPTVAEIVQQDYNLIPNRYLLPTVEGIALREVLVPVKGKKAEKGVTGHLITPKHLRKGQEGEGVSVDRLQPSSTFESWNSNRQVQRAYQVEESVLLITVVGTSLLPAYFDDSMDNFPALVSPEVKAFRINRSKVDPAYLIHELESTTVQQQLAAYRIGGPPARLAMKDFLRVRIPLPSLQEQKAKVAALKEVSQQIVELRKEQTEIAEGGRLERRQRFASLKHTLGRPQQSILSAARTIKGYLKILGSEGNAIDQAYAQFYEQDRTISDTLQEIIDNVDFISRLMDKGENGLRVEDYPLTKIFVSDLYNEIKRTTSDHGCKFKIEFKPDKPATEWYKYQVEVNLHLLRILLENLITNANKHGFEEASPHNIMQISLTGQFGSVLEVKNNGKPFPRNFGKEQFIQEFSRTHQTSGEGIGGYQIDQIARYFGDPDWQLDTDASQVFPVLFTFTLKGAQLLITL